MALLILGLALYWVAYAGFDIFETLCVHKRKREQYETIWICTFFILGTIVLLYWLLISGGLC